ncbi:MAG: homoserine kinase, partial [Chloroflexota bacterium]|nr:homoserine kinase [Chloroflexota bacterium]
MPASIQQVTVRVPATSANLGPGFDCLGLALDLYLEIRCRTTAAGLAVRVRQAEPAAAGPLGAAGISTGPDNPIYQAIRRVYEAANEPCPGIELDIDNGIPLSRGLGSSAAAIAAGLMAANSLLGGGFDRRRLLSIGLPLEGHPDNLAPALFGGLTVSAVVDGRVLTVPVEIKSWIGVALFVPDVAMSTSEARAVLPEKVPRGDAVFNVSRAALLVAALAGGDSGVLRWAMEDRLHQPYRARLFPALPRLIAAALEAGAAGAAMSGAGSSVIAFCTGEAQTVADAMGEAAARLGVAGTPMVA